MTDPANRFTVLRLTDLLNMPHDPEIDEFREAEYRRGYCDGWVAAANAIWDLWFLGKGRFRDRLLDHWEGLLDQWAREDSKENLVLPPILRVPRCVYCGAPAQHKDHILPRSRGGTDDDDNLVTACAVCNRSKRDKTPEEWHGIDSASLERLAPDEQY